MIEAFIIFNNLGKARLVKFYTEITCILENSSLKLNFV